jgi:hypothetical protein
MIGVGRTRPVTPAAEHHPVSPKNIDKSVASYTELFSEPRFAQTVKLAATASGKLLTKRLTVISDAAYEYILFGICFFVLVVSLAGDVKQSAKGGYSINYTFTRLL